MSFPSGTVIAGELYLNGMAGPTDSTTSVTGVLILDGVASVAVVTITHVTTGGLIGVYKYSATADADFNHGADTPLGNGGWDRESQGRRMDGRIGAFGNCGCECCANKR